MQIKKIIIYSFLALIILGMHAPQLVLAETETDSSEIKYAPIEVYELEVPIGDKNMVTGIGDYLSTIYTFSIGIVGIIAALLIIYGGFRWLTALGNSKVIGEAQETIVSAVVGLILALGSYLILNSINPQLLNIVLSIPYITLPEPPAATGTYNIDACSLDNTNLTNITYTAFSCSKYSEPGGSLTSAQIMDAINKNRGSVSPVFLLSIIKAESGWCTNAESETGCAGMTQFLPSTAKQYIPRCDSSFNVATATTDQIQTYLKSNPYVAICMQAKYYVDLSAQNGGNEVLMAAGYSVGQAANAISSKCAGVPIWQCPAEDYDKYRYSQARSYIPIVAANKNAMCKELGGTVTSSPTTEEMQNQSSL